MSEQALRPSLNRSQGAVLLALGVALLGLGLAFYRATQIGLWSDEFHSIRLSRLPLGQLLAGDYRDTQPPLYYALLQLYAGVAGWSELSLRLFSLAWFVPVLLLSFFVARELWMSDEASAMTTAIIALHPFFLNYAVEIRSYAMIAAIGLAAVYSYLRLLRATERELAGEAMALALTSCLSLYVHHFGILVPAGIAAMSLANLGTQAGRRRSLLTLAMLVLAALAYIPGALLLLQQLDIYRPQGAATSLPISYLFQVYSFSYHRPAYEWLISLLGAAGLLLALTGTISARATRRASLGLLLALLACVGLGLSAAALGVAIIPRYVIQLVLLANLGLGALLALPVGPWRRAGQFMGALLLVAYLAYSLDFTAHAGREAQIAGFKADWRFVSQVIGQTQEDGEPLVIMGWDGVAVQHYLGQTALTSFDLTSELEAGPRPSYLLLLSENGRNYPHVGEVELLYDDPLEQVTLLRLRPAGIDAGN